MSLQFLKHDPSALFKSSNAGCKVGGGGGGKEKFNNHNKRFGKNSIVLQKSRGGAWPSDDFCLVAERKFFFMPC